MKDYFEAWVDGIGKMKSDKLPAELCVTGEFNGYLVYAHQHAMIRMRIAPAQNLEVIVDDIVIPKVQYEEFIDWAVFGLLDILAFHKPLPYFNIRIVVEDAGRDRIDCSPMAFRFAGRDAGRKIVQEIDALRAGTGQSSPRPKLELPSD